MTSNRTLITESSSTFYILLLLGCFLEVSIQSVPGGKVNILGGHCIYYFKQKSVHVHVPHSERFPR
jgi:hypothetical protein